MQMENGGYIKNSSRSTNRPNKKVGVNIVAGSKCLNKIIDDGPLNLFDTKTDPRDAQIEYRAAQKASNQIPNSPIEIKHIDKCRIDKEIEFTLDDFLSDNENSLLDNNPKLPQSKNKPMDKKQSNAKNNKKCDNDSFASLILQKKQQRKSLNDQKEKDINNNLLNNYNQLQMINKIEMMKDFEKMKQLKDLEQVQNLLEMDKVKQRSNVSYPNNNMIPISQPIQNITPNYPLMPNMIPNPWDYQQQQMMYMLWQQQQYLQYQYYSQMGMMYYHQSHSCMTTQSRKYNQNTIYTPKKPIQINEPNYCSYCEEVYKYTIVNNLPLRIITCAYCQTTINQITLDFFLTKYKKDLYENYSQKLNQLDSNCSIQETPKKQLNQNKFSFSSLVSSSPPHTDSILQSEPSSVIKYPPLPKRRLVEMNKDKTSSEALNVSENNISLAQAFKQRHFGLINKIQKRALSVKDNSLNNSREISEINIQRDKDKRFKQRLSKSLVKAHSRNNSEADNVSVKDDNTLLNKIIISNQKPKKVTEPSAELLDRLIHGKRAKMTQKEMRELNKRLVRNLAEVKYQKVDDQKQQSLSLLSEKKIQFTQSLMQSVISSYKKNKQN